MTVEIYTSWNIKTKQMTLETYIRSNIYTKQMTVENYTSWNIKKSKWLLKPISDQISIQSKWQLKIILHEILKQSKWHLKPMWDEIFIQTKSQSWNIETNVIILETYTTRCSKLHLKLSTLPTCSNGWNRGVAHCSKVWRPCYLSLLSDWDSLVPLELACKGDT